MFERFLGQRQRHRRRSNRCWRRSGWRRRCFSPGPKAWAKPPWRAAWARACWAIRSRSSRTISACRTTWKRWPRARSGRREAQRRPAAVRDPPRFRHLRARWAAAPDLHPADAPAQGPGANLLPHKGSRRIFLIDHVDRANDQAANSLLKTLEEPPDHLVLIMTAENAYDLLPTIRSRAVPFHFAPLAGEEMQRVRAGARPGPAGAAHRAGRGQPGAGRFARPGSLRQAPRRHAGAAEGGRRRWRRSAPGCRFPKPSAAARAKSWTCT